MYIDQVAVGSIIAVPGRFGQPAEQGVVTEIINTAQECAAIVHVPNPADHRGYTPRRVPLMRRTITYRCKLDDTRQDLPICPLANVRCHSPCDIDALAFGPSFNYPVVVRTPDEVRNA